MQIFIQHFSMILNCPAFEKREAAASLFCIIHILRQTSSTAFSTSFAMGISPTPAIMLSQ